MSMAKVEFFGVRGSHPTPRIENLRFGGNTSCVLVYSDDDPEREFPIIFDLGTGLTRLAQELDSNQIFSGVSFVSHLHFDHIQGLPFFSPIDRVGSRLRILAPSEANITAKESFDLLFSSPFFPVKLGDLRGEITIESMVPGSVTLAQPGSPLVTASHVSHTNSTFGYRLEIDGKVIVYIADHQAPLDSQSVDDSVVELCRAADLLIHDAQYTPDEFQKKSHWGHSTYNFAVQVALRSGVRSLAFYHHDPGRTDDELDRIEKSYEADGIAFGFSIFAAREGMKLEI